VLVSIADELEIDLQPNYMQRVHRLGQKKRNKENPRPIIAKFVSYRKRNGFLTNKRNLKNIEATQCVLSGFSDWEGGRAMRRRKPMAKQGLNVVHLCRLTAKVKRALLRLPHQYRLNYHLLIKTPQDSESAIIADGEVFGN